MQGSECEYLLIRLQSNRLTAVSRQWRHLKLPETDEWRQILGMVWSTPLVPAHRFGEAVVAVENAMINALLAADATAALQNKCYKYLRYLTQYWGRIPDIVSVAGHTTRTNNISEGFNRQLPAKLAGRRPSLVQFLKQAENLLDGEKRSLLKVELLISIFRGGRGLVEQRIIRQKRERKWVREAARRLSEEEDLLVPYNFREEEVYDFFGIRWMMEGNRGLDHPSDFWGLLGANNGSSSIFDFYDNLAKRKNLKRKCT
ncbi:hypothetical protein PV325_009533 [Microctonus aethiopoides]|nr:hypothetical protein PV325_009533 [Microctonus aethiopoides]